MNKKLYLNPNPKDDELLLLLQQGDEKAFTLIYNRYHKLLYVVAYKYLKDRFMAEDAVQHIFFKLWEHHKVLSISVNLKNFLYTMLKNFLLNEIRNNTLALEKNYEMAQENTNYENDLIEKLEQKELMTEFYEAINSLPVQKKTICLLKLRGGLSNQDIAQQLNISITTVKTHYSQSIKLLREHFSKIVFVIFLWIIS